MWSPCAVSQELLHIAHCYKQQDLLPKLLAAANCATAELQSSCSTQAAVAGSRLAATAAVVQAVAQLQQSPGGRSATQYRDDRAVLT